MPAEAVLHILSHAENPEAWAVIEADCRERPVTVLLLREAVLSPPHERAMVVASRADCEKHGAVRRHKTVDYVEILQLIDEHDDIRRW